MLIAALPILIELFTSEGCSSCPPADAALARLHEKQPLPGVELLVLSEHVDYWDRLGWRDPFSDALFTNRQEHYGPRLYTPQAVIDGRIDVLGSDEAGIVRAAGAAAHDPHGAIALKRSARGVRLEVRGLPAHEAAQVFLAVVEDGLVSHVVRGENEGRTLQHTAVVRALDVAGNVAAGAAQWSGEAELRTRPEWKKVRVVAFVQESQSRRILAAGGLSR